jgi:uncharacterized membrane protein
MSFRFWSPRTALFAVAVVLLPAVARANEAVLLNQSAHTVYITTQVFQHANQTHSGYDSWVTQGWWAVGPGKAIKL